MFSTIRAIPGRHSDRYSHHLLTFFILYWTTFVELSYKHMSCANFLGSINSQLEVFEDTMDGVKDSILICNKLLSKAYKRTFYGHYTSDTRGGL